MPRKPERRLTAVFASFVALVNQYAASATEAVVAAIMKAIGAPGVDSKGRPAAALKGPKGGEFPLRLVDVSKFESGLMEALPRDLAGDVRELARAVTAECDRRGVGWERYCLATAIEDFVIKPLGESVGAVASKAKTEKAEKTGKKAA